MPFVRPTRAVIATDCEDPESVFLMHIIFHTLSFCAEKSFSHFCASIIIQLF